MKKTIVFGSLLAVFLMLMIPNVSAIEYKTIRDTSKKIVDARTNEKLKNFNGFIESLLKERIIDLKKEKPFYNQFSNIYQNIQNILIFLSYIINIFGILLNIYALINTLEQQLIQLHIVYLIIHLILLLFTMKMDKNSDGAGMIN
jgi:hypothetical protein